MSQNLTSKIGFVFAALDIGSLEKKTLGSLRRVFPKSEIVVVIPPGAKYTPQDYRCTFVEQEPQGIYSAYNFGSQSIRAEWVAFLGSGDRFVHNAGRIFQSTLSTYPNANVMGFGSAWTNPFKGIFSKTHVRQDDLWNEGVLATGMPVSHQALFTKTDVLRSVGGFTETFKIASDFEFVCKLVMTGHFMVQSKTIIALVDNSGLSTIDKELLLVEHHKVISKNLQDCSLETSKHILQWSRGWTTTLVSDFEQHLPTKIRRGIEENLSSKLAPVGGIRIGSRHITRT
jgi:hypothetical protein